MEEIYKTLIAKVLSDRASEEDEKEFQNWINSDPENEIIFKEVEKVWRLKVKRDKSYSPDTKNEWLKLKQKIEAEKGSPKVFSIPTESKVKWYGIAATFIILIGIGYILATSSNNQITKQTASSLTVFYLPDSSIVYLNKNSKLSYSKTFDGNERLVELEGEAFFQIRKDSLRPFIIEAGNTKTKVIGTSFDLRAYKDDQNIELVVVNGKVNFSTDNETVVLAKNEKGNFSKESKQLSSGKNNHPEFCAWKNDRTALRKTELYKMEQTQALDYLQTESKWRTNKINQTIIEGLIHNTSLFTQYKNIQMKTTYFDKEGNKIGESKFRINKTILPGMSVSYKHSLRDWFENTTNVKTEIAEAGEIQENF